MIKLYPILLSRRSVIADPGITFQASYTTDINADSSNGDPVPTSTTGSPVVSGGYLILDSGATTISVYYDSVDNESGGEQGAIRIPIRPNYSGSPSAAQYYCNVTGGTPDHDDILIIHRANGFLSFEIRNSTSSTVITLEKVWSPTSGVTYELELNWDWTGAGTISYAFIAGVEHDSLIGEDAEVRLSQNTEIRLGRAGNNSDFDVGQLTIFNKIQHTANYTP